MYFVWKIVKNYGNENLELILVDNDVDYIFCLYICCDCCNGCMV